MVKRNLRKRKKLLEDNIKRVAGAKMREGKNYENK